MLFSNWKLVGESLLDTFGSPLSVKTDDSSILSLSECNTMTPVSYTDTNSSVREENTPPTDKSVYSSDYDNDDFELWNITPTVNLRQPEKAYQHTSFSQSFSFAPQQLSHESTPRTSSHREPFLNVLAATFDKKNKNLGNRMIYKRCFTCSTTTSSQWYLDSKGYNICHICNDIWKTALDSRTVSKQRNKRQKKMPSLRRADLECSNCGTNETSLWRRNDEMKPVCNACGLYRKLHKADRPLSMKKVNMQIRKRKRKTKEMKESDIVSKKKVRYETVTDTLLKEDTTPFSSSFSSSSSSSCPTTPHQNKFHQQMDDPANIHELEVIEPFNTFHLEMSLPTNNYKQETCEPTINYGLNMWEPINTYVLEETNSCKLNGQMPTDIFTFETPGPTSAYKLEMNEPNNNYQLNMSLLTNTYQMEVPQATTNKYQMEVPQATTNNYQMEVPQATTNNYHLEVPQETTNTYQLEVPQATTDTYQLEVPQETHSYQMEGPQATNTYQVEEPQEIIYLVDIQEPTNAYNLQTYEGNNTCYFENLELTGIDKLETNKPTNMYKLSIDEQTNIDDLQMVKSSDAYHLELIDSNLLDFNSSLCSEPLSAVRNAEQYPSLSDFGLMTESDVYAQPLSSLLNMIPDWRVKQPNLGPPSTLII